MQHKVVTWGTLFLFLATLARTVIGGSRGQQDRDLAQKLAEKTIKDPMLFVPNLGKINDPQEVKRYLEYAPSLRMAFPKLHEQIDSMLANKESLLDFVELYKTLGDYFEWPIMIYYTSGKHEPSKWDLVRRLLVQLINAMHQEHKDEITDSLLKLDYAKGKGHIDQEGLNEVLSIILETNLEALISSKRFPELIKALQVSRPLQGILTALRRSSMAVQNMDRLANASQENICPLLHLYLVSQDKAMILAVLEHLSSKLVTSPPNIRVFTACMIGNTTDPTLLQSYLKMLPDAKQIDQLFLDETIVERISSLQMPSRAAGFIQAIASTTRQPSIMIESIRRSKLNEPIQSVAVLSTILHHKYITPAIKKDIDQNLLNPKVCPTLRGEDEDDEMIMFELVESLEYILGNSLQDDKQLLEPLLTKALWRCKDFARFVKADADTYPTLSMLVDMARRRNI